ncbi:unnamed protein product [Orchesella dallaii]|uniref:Uncharacterized protein n=1 Tax=Orchesella dallaii TaxID=48710 RepID=A0ABP1RL32_9HEXA
MVKIDIAYLQFMLLHWLMIFPAGVFNADVYKALRIYELGTNSLETNGHKKIEIHPPKEYADTLPALSQKDEIIDEAWWIFSFVYGYCFHHFQNSSINGERNKDPIRQQKQNPLNVPTAEEFFQLFEKDFLNDLKTRW